MDCLVFIISVEGGQCRTLCPLTSLGCASQCGAGLSLQDVLGFNMAGLQFLKREIEAKDEVTFFADATERFEEKKRKRKKKEKMVLSLL